MAIKIRRHDEVVVISGDDKGKRGRVLAVFRDKNRVLVEGVNFVKRHTKPRPGRQGGIVEKEAPGPRVQPHDRGPAGRRRFAHRPPGAGRRQENPRGARRADKRFPRGASKS